MSSINGDKSRFNRVRKQRIFQRQRNRILVHGLVTSSGENPQAAAKPPLPTPPAMKPGDIQS
jgi:hypothetical protein